MKKITQLTNELINLVQKEVIQGNYKIVRIEKNVSFILLEECHTCSLWISDRPEISFCIWSNFLNLPMDKFSFNTNKERIKSFHIYKEKEKSYLQTKGKRDKQKQINKLKKELEQLEKEL
tara:strand:+ start:929 stop:1288 length:360 start_codon:yes stop_codon:yes gene_type:complete